MSVVGAVVFPVDASQVADVLYIVVANLHVVEMAAALGRMAPVVELPPSSDKSLETALPAPFATLAVFSE